MDFFRKERISLYIYLVLRGKKFSNNHSVPIWLKFKTKSFLHGILLFNMFWFEKGKASSRLDSRKVTFKNTKAPIVLIDVQALKNATFFRGIGRYSLSLAKALAFQEKNINFLLFSTNFGNQGNTWLIEKYVSELKLPNLKFCIIDLFDSKLMISQAESELVLFRELEKFNPQFILVPSHFEHPFDAIHLFPYIPLPIFVIVHDIIPWRFQKDLLRSRSEKTFYFNRIKELSKFTGVLAVSEYTAADVKSELPKETNIKVIGGAGFTTGIVTKKKPLRLRRGILTIGADTPHKNIDRLLLSYSLLPKEVQIKHPLTVVGISLKTTKRNLNIRAKSLGIKLIIPNLLSERELRTLYAKTRLVVVPSLAEGLSMPVMEGWLAGAVVLGGKETVLEEVLHHEELLFDPYSPKDMASAVHRFLVDDKLWSYMLKLSIKRLEIFNWGNVADRLMESTSK